MITKSSIHISMQTQYLELQKAKQVTFTVPEETTGSV